MMNLQTLNIAPRDDANPRLARLDESRLSVGNDGVLYKLSDSRDWNKYYTLSDHELSLEYKRSQEVKQNMMMFSGKLASDGTARHRSGSGIKAVAPQFGTSSRVRRMETKKWSKELTQAGHGMSTQNIDGKFRDTITQLQENTQNLAVPPPEEDFEFVVDHNADTSDNVKQVFRVIKQKYEQNLHVIDKLYDERQSLEEYTRSLERKLMEVTGRPVEALGLREDSEKPPSRAQAQPQANINQFRPEEVADMLGNPTFVDEPNYGPPRGRSRQRAPQSMRSQSLNHTRTQSRDRERSQSSRRSLSLTRSGISPHLQADIDHYVQKRRLMDENERLAALEAEEEEKRRRQRFLNASVKGRGFVEMEERQRIQAEEKAQRLLAMKRAEKEKEFEERRLREEKKKKENELMAAAVRSSMSWQEMQDAVEAKRRENIETRKQELLMMSALPPSLAESLQRVKRTPKGSDTEELDFRPRIRTEEPEVVARRLARQQKAWSQRLSQTKEKLREQYLTQRSMSASGMSTESASIAKMESRAAECKARRDARLQALQEKEAREREARKRAEREKAEKLRSAKLPESSLKATKAAKMREERVKNELLERELEEQREKKLREQKNLKLKEAAVVLKAVIRERDEDLRAKNPGARLELSEAEHESRERAARAREEFRAKLRANKERIRNSLKNRPSLMERHDQGVANRTAATQALRTLTQAFTQGDEHDEMDDLEAMLDSKAKGAASRKNSAQSGAGKSSNGVLDALMEGDDVFDAKEKVIVQSILSKQ